MKITITGGAGFIGSHLTDKLLSLNREVLVIDNYQTGRPDNLTPHPRLTVIEETISNTKAINKIFDDFKPDLVVHAAASYKDPQNWLEDAQTNIIGTINIVRASQAAKIKRLVYFQTSLCYGLKPLEQPITFKHPLFSGAYTGGSSYAISKTAGEQYIELSGLDFISFRLANAYGPRNLSGPLPTFYQRLTNNQLCFVIDSRRDFIFIDDLIEVVLKALQGQGEKGYYHISTGSDYAIKELYQEAVRALGLENAPVETRPRGPDDAPSILLDPAKTIADFNWQPKISLKNGIKQTIDWYKTHDISQTFTHLKIHEKQKTK
ncbi:MAG TPA: nucleotide sugar epimerase [Candidatus Jacksonbacteria bacterium]|nr:MAG: NAD-dependent epimerase/dehydratase [Parcubacteria group bacterium GW2011_GWC2_44_22]OGY74646.1 MAG: nucleotide sugar epimerase [Candidatus Jacksonbacteria bacterium RIFOXYA2_FULL_43_12]OGY75349.1 MAG: nucleotide sugar epimerase [Candidatus Jacksonbacteria bacterium RIFOXYB2_FULL_44_15]OGY82041.1 MAG: nucleotide sugar epimerase [Candidatus Jacksonbacteria bacterium RIFOXYD2_FULL_43_21]HBH45854.1 nucleotide sugar epimerase [Candidatus Jacksonbacteria bacterium]